MERIISNKIDIWIQNQCMFFPSSLQHGYQNKLCSLMASFTLQECLSYNVEHGSPVYIAFLDSATAFDLVWHDGLFVKLHDLGIKGKLWKLIYQFYQDRKNCVLWKGIKSDWIDVKQSVRQGSVLGPWYFIVYLNELLEMLLQSGNGARIGDIYCGAPTQADDMALMSLSPSGLQNMLDICLVYANKWRLLYNSSKSKLLIVGLSKCKQDKLLFTWRLGSYMLEVVSSYKHVDIIINSRMSRSVLKS
jgi:hypothetical protein